MTKTLRCCAALVFTMFVTTATADPIELKLSFFTSDRSVLYLSAIKPFVDAVNTEAKGLLHIRAYPGGALGKDVTLQPQLVLNGDADLALIAPGLSPKLFPDNAVIELPGLYSDVREASEVYTRLLAQGALSGYRDFVPISGFMTEPETVHSRTPITSIDDFKGKRIRVSNSGEAAAVAKLGAMPIAMPVREVVGAMSSGEIDATVISLTPLTDFGIRRVATYHYLLPTSGAALALVMSRATFTRLPPAAQLVIQKYSGPWAVERFVGTYGTNSGEVLQQLTQDGTRKVTTPSPSDAARAEVAFKAVQEDLVAGNAHYRSLLDTVEDDLRAVRSPE